MLDSARLLVLSSLYYFGFTYAAFTALKQRVILLEEGEGESSSPSPPNAQPAPQRPKVLIGIPALKLMIMLTSMALLSFVGAEWFPLFAEMRVIFMYTLLFSPPFTQQEIYDQLFGPLLVRGGTLALALQTSNFLSRKVPLFVARCCVDCGIAAMNYVQRHHTLSEDAVKDILSGLVFSRRALQQVADLSRDADGATYVAIARDSNFAVGVFASHVKRALLNEEAEGEGEGEIEVPRAPVPVGRVTRETDSWYPRDVPVATAWTGSPTSNGRPDGLVESIHSERDFQGANAAEVRRSDRSGREKRKRRKLFGLF